MKTTVIAILSMSILFLALSPVDKTSEKVNIRIKAKSQDKVNPIYIQTMEFGENRTFVKGDNGIFNLSLDVDKIYSVYVGQKGQQTVLFNVNTHIEDLPTGNFSFSIEVMLNPKLTNQEKKVHDIEIVTKEGNKPTLLFKKKN